jgi:hypothetical protein
MDWDQTYVKGNLREAIYTLVVSPDDIRKRLAQVYKLYLFKLRKENFPEKLQYDWEWIQKELKRFGPIKREDGSTFIGSVDHTCRRIKNKTGVKIAEKLLAMYLYLEEN